MRKRWGVRKGFSGSANSFGAGNSFETGFYRAPGQRNEHEGMIGGLVNASAKRKKKERGATRGLIYLSTGTISPWNAKDESNILVILCEYTIHHSLTTDFFRSCIRFRVKDRWSILIRSFDRSSIQSPTRFRVSFWKGKCKKKSLTNSIRDFLRFNFLVNFALKRERVNIVLYI